MKWFCPDCKKIFCSRHVVNHESKNKIQSLDNAFDNVKCIICKAIEDHKKK